MKFFSAKKIFPPKKIKLRVQIKISEIKISEIQISEIQISEIQISEIQISEIQISEKSDFRLNAMKKILSRKIIKIYVFTFERI